MKENNSFEEIWDKIRHSKKVLISLHKGPDGDSLGSCAALEYVLKRDLNLDVKIVSKDKLDGTLMKLSFVKDIEFGKSIDDLNLKEFDTVILLDFGTISGFSGKGMAEIENDTLVINIDHHVTNTYFGNLNYGDSKKPSCCSILLEMFRELKIKFDKELANRLLLGVCTDSGFFKNSNAVPSLKDAYELIENGADYSWILENILGKTSLKLKKYYAYIINNLKINKKKSLGYSLVPKKVVDKLDLNLAEIRLGIHQIKDIEGLDFVFTLTETDEYIKGSFRSRNIDVSQFARQLGKEGGGHKVAAAFRLKNMTLENAKKEVLDVIEKVGIHKIC